MPGQKINVEKSKVFGGGGEGGVVLTTSQLSKCGRCYR